MRDYHNTNKERGPTLAASKLQKRTQQDRILDFLRANPRRWFAPHEVQELMLPNTPLTSVRSCLTNLTDAGLITKSEQPNRLGSYGKYVHTWAYVPEEGRKPKQQQLWQ